MAEVVVVCKSNEKGTTKKAVAEDVLEEECGLIGDACGDRCNRRQVDLLAMRSIDRVRRLDLNVGPGDFAENLTRQGGKSPLRWKEYSRIGHPDCRAVPQPLQYPQETGKSSMPREGIFARAIHGGRIRAGDHRRMERNG